MILTRDRLKKIIKEELEEMMGQPDAVAAPSQAPQINGDIAFGQELVEIASDAGIGLQPLVDFMKLALKGQPIPHPNERIKRRMVTLIGRYSLDKNPDALPFILASLNKARPNK